MQIYGSMDGEMRERVAQGRKVVGFLGCIMKERSVNMEVRKELHDEIVILTITLANETWVWNEIKTSKQ